MPSFRLQNRRVGPEHPPLVIAEVGINHQGDLAKAKRMVDDAARVGCECVKFQCHIPQAEMIPNQVVPANADQSIWDIMSQASLEPEQEAELKVYVEEKGMIYLCTPFSREAADRLAGLGVSAFKIGSGECNNYPLLEHIAGLGKPVILSTGMNDLPSVARAVEIFERAGVPLALMHCTSLYPTPYDKVRLGALAQMARAFPDLVLGLSDHSLGIYTCLAAVALGACILEKHFTSDKSWSGPDIPISLDPEELAQLIQGSRAVHQALGGEKTVLPEEQPTIDFAYACVVSLRPIAPGQVLSRENVWVKRPGTGPIKAAELKQVLGRRAARAIAAHQQISWSDLAPEEEA